MTWEWTVYVILRVIKLLKEDVLGIIGISWVTIQDETLILASSCVYLSD
jgi:hypothetical protein